MGFWGFYQRLRRGFEQGTSIPSTIGKILGNGNKQLY